MCGTLFLGIFSVIKEGIGGTEANGVRTNPVLWEHCEFQCIWGFRDLGKLLESFILPKYSDLMNKRFSMNAK